LFRSWSTRREDRRCKATRSRCRCSSPSPTRDAIQDKKLFYLPVEFPPNVDTARAASPEIRMEIPVTHTENRVRRTAMIAGFQLTPEEVAAWRRNNPR
jgi:hypothetical protein